MGYWAANPQGGLDLAGTGTERIWGDDPADILGDAFAAVARVFLRDVGRKPTEAELLAGAQFAIGGLIALDDIEETA